MKKKNAEYKRLAEDVGRIKNWKRWGTYLAERQWGTIREDDSPNGTCWEYFPHDHARSLAYRWGEDGLLGITDRQCRLCFAPALWNGQDPIFKERLFGLTGPEGNHGEVVKAATSFPMVFRTWIKSACLTGQSPCPQVLATGVIFNKSQTIFQID